MKIFPFVPSVLSLVVSAQLQGITEIDWPKGVRTRVGVVLPCHTNRQASRSGGTQGGFYASRDSPFTSHPCPVIHDNPSLPSAEYATQNGPFSNPSAYPPHPEASVSGYSQREQSPEPQSTSQKLDGDLHFGDLTHYEVGVGACGQDSTGQGDTGNIVALSKVLFDAARIDTNPNNNPLCGRTIIIKGSNGKISHGTVLDQCEGCKMSDIYVSHKIFKEIWGSLDKGRKDIQWWYS
ncbi:hypothetical protein AU210_015931 [Fusarium oxysporum f. sp. radicis-cucumerinum]|uniref:Uncharacterized protein n=2 Tax=Fusarium oxysporum TaxID=5507 RepID=A0A2H3FUD9_FUSOX|nr:hypothetical protein AU210_016774 [Fusarium oxysporum f. sp. radicis-cucumerinum]PCD22116.1 hypothetical protein AU210_015916 [Fusarium oxysporum f. sp. radicis-cucumerinum]PCD22132.1 hypothetical protein AU210_015931 [Fusarium oxysporum f. sp. radicis-cucumerinum]